MNTLEFDMIPRKIENITISTCNHRWIEIQKRFPADKQIVLVCNHEEMQVCKFDITEYEYFFTLLNTSYQIKNVTHWMLLPEFPTPEVMLKNVSHEF